MKWRRFWSVLIFVTIALTACAPSYFSRGNIKFSEGDYDGAIEEYSKAIKSQPYEFSAFINRGRAKQHKGDYDGAFADYKKASQIEPGYYAVYLLLASLDEEKGNYSEAIVDYDIAILLKSDNPEAYVGRGNAKHHKGSYQEAVEDYTKAIKLKPGLFIGYLNRAIAKSNMRDYNGAIDDYNKAIELQPNKDLAYFNRGNAKFYKGHYDEAIVDYSKAIELQPKKTAAYINRGRAKLLKGDYDEAIIDCNKAINLEPENADAYFNRAKAKEGKVNNDEAIADISKAIELKPSEASLYFYRARLEEEKKGDRSRAISDYDTAILLKSDFVDAYFYRGNAKASKGDYEGAIDDYSKTIELAPDYSYAFLNRAIMYEKYSMFVKAIKDYRKSLELNIDSANAKKYLENLFSVLNGNAEFIKKIQIMLASLDYYKGKIDGTYENTTAAIRKFQEMNHIEQTGSVNNETHLHLTKHFADMGELSIKSEESVQLAINFPREDYETSDSEIPLDVSINSKEEIEKIIIKINGRNLEESPSIVDFNSNKLSANIDTNISISEGQNTIKVVAQTSRHNVSKSVRITRIKNTQPINKGEKWALLIGIENYDDIKIPTLNFAADDAEEFSKILIEKGRFSHVILLTDKVSQQLTNIKRELPTRDNIIRALSDLAKKTRAEDTVVIYYSGHGTVIPDRLSPTGTTTYIIPKDFEYDHPSVKGIRLDDIKRYSYVSPERMFLILDSCFSGSASNSIGGTVKTIPYEHNLKGSIDDITKGFENADKGKARIVLSSSLGNQTSLELNRLKHGVFTYYLLDILQQGKERLADIYSYIHDKVTELTNNEQEPQFESTGQRGDVLIY